MKRAILALERPTPEAEKILSNEPEPRLMNDCCDILGTKIREAVEPKITTEYHDPETYPYFTAHHDPETYPYFTGHHDTKTYAIVSILLLNRSPQGYKAQQSRRQSGYHQ